jgi:hypothetical protein
MIEYGSSPEVRQETELLNYVVSTLLARQRFRGHSFWAAASGPRAHLQITTDRELALIYKH